MAATAQLTPQPRSCRIPFPGEIVLKLVLGSKPGQPLRPNTYAIDLYLPPEKEDSIENRFYHGAFYIDSSDKGQPWIISAHSRIKQVNGPFKWATMTSSDPADFGDSGLTVEQIRATKGDLALCIGAELAEEISGYITDLLAAYGQKASLETRFRFTDIAEFIKFYLRLYQICTEDAKLPYRPEGELCDMWKFWTDPEYIGGGQQWLAYYFHPAVKPDDGQTMEEFEAERQAFKKLLEDSIAAVEQALSILESSSITRN